MIIIPDIHGRRFWKDAVKGREDEEIVFLGDYLDPYPEERISYSDALTNFEEIIAFKKKHGGNVTLLVGNHDQHYFIPDAPTCSRYSWAYARRFYRVFNENYDRFLLTIERTFGGQKYVFSHAGVIDGWVKECVPNPSDNVCDYLNNLYLTKPRLVGGALGANPKVRGGLYDHGSCTWADINEHYEAKDVRQESVRGAYQIFGHNQLKEDPIICENFACLDVRRAFTLYDDGVIREMDGKPAILFDEVLKKLEK